MRDKNTDRTKKHNVSIITRGMEIPPMQPRETPQGKQEPTNNSSSKPNTKKEK